jgi:hypothetical protein
MPLEYLSIGPDILPDPVYVQLRLMERQLTLSPVLTLSMGK